MKRATDRCFSFFLLLLCATIGYGQASFKFLSTPEEFHPDGTLAVSSIISFEMANVPNDADNAINLRFYVYPDGINTTDANGDPVANIGWTQSSDKMNMLLGILNDPDVNNPYYRTETVFHGDTTFTKTYSIFNVSNNGEGETYKNGGIVDGEHYAPIIRVVHANGQPRYNNSGALGMGNGNNPLIVDQETLDQSPDVVATHFAFSYYPPEENATTGGGEFPHITANSAIDLFGSGSSKEFQIITFDPVPKMSTTALPFEISATSSSGLTDIAYSIESGPATISGQTVTLDGTEGTVTLKATQAGDSTYLPGETFLQFEVVDLSTLVPSISTRLTEDYPLQMPSFHAYPIYVTADIAEAELISIDNLEITVDNLLQTVIKEGEVYYALWKPDSYGSHQVDITAYGSNGNNSVLSKNIEVTDAISTQNVETMDEVVIQINTENSRWYYGSFTMPQHVGSYEQIIANMTVECPAATGDCDDWDRWAHIDVKGPEGNWIQIIRYITPYRVECDHMIDLTDYQSLLQGEVEFRMFIDTWGTGGWQVSLDFDFREGSPDYLYSTIDEIWDKSYDLGNPSDLQQVEDVIYTYEANILSSHLRLSTTGHGWGANNSQNAAEFYEATNFIDIDGVSSYTQNLWNDCDPNPDGCLGQQGTWWFSRAGWCPGAIAHPDIVDMTSQIPKGSINLGYRFDPTYVDYCHPDNPDCISGVTCDDCDDGFRARYIVDAQVINFSNSPLLQLSSKTEEIDNVARYNLYAHPNPSNGIIRISSPDQIGKSVVNFVSISGEILRTYYFDSSQALNNKLFDLSSLAKGVYFVSVENEAGQGNLKLILK